MTLPTAAPGPADATTHCSSWPSRPGCASPSSPVCDAATFSSPPDRTSAAPAKGRKNRITPLTPTTTAILEVWLAERAGDRHEPAFPTARGGRLTRDALDHRITKYIDIAAQRCPTLHEKRVTPHTLRHTAAMRLLHAGVDTTVIALWLGHERVDTTQIYLHADLALKERAIARTTPPDTRPGRYKPPDTLLAFLEAL